MQTESKSLCHGGIFMSKTKRIVSGIIMISLFFSLSVTNLKKDIPPSYIITVMAKGNSDTALSDRQYSKIHQWLTDHANHPEKIKDKHVKKSGRWRMRMDFIMYGINI